MGFTPLLKVCLYARWFPYLGYSSFLLRPLRFQWKALHVSIAFPSWWNSDPKFCLPLSSYLVKLFQPSSCCLPGQQILHGRIWSERYTQILGVPLFPFRNFPQCHHCASPRVQLLIQWRLSAIEFSDFSACVQTDRCTSGNPQKKSQINAVLMQYSSYYSVFCFPLVPAFFNA